uniref:Putative secreted protein n=1 Tax=Anopheles marajoara TaxID=58244 RepID=A0A2M4C822_9DIPT
MYVQRLLVLPLVPSVGLSIYRPQNMTKTLRWLAATANGWKVKLRMLDTLYRGHTCFWSQHPAPFTTTRRILSQLSGNSALRYPCFAQCPRHGTLPAPSAVLSLSFHEQQKQ